MSDYYRASSLSLHLIFRSAVNFISLSDQSLTSSSTVLLFAILADSSYKASDIVSVFLNTMISSQDSAVTVYTLIFSFSEVCAFLTVFMSNAIIILSEDCVILTYQNSQYKSHVSASADILSAQIILK
ncbi:hypothetical protein BDBG_16804 [Blastomyces gilchristii SLH14081]|uniref:Uncharacterized protein n=1 Tax=Blastomyces gilchristii (strain SLH14081) TaxID=559298 RepID=A0A179UJA2_BLAGS|nr:uncharacterized protein BDBG_16804 [Blastomyces gilchristii SLH14081]OAT07299.1 hypothetical protein BDBG_16804 [Blastomyces gilchristii SLH14081]